jgi:hypothetical protein
MCFSAEASFTAGAALVPAGVYCVSRALSRNARYLLLALVPLAFAAQQFAEGMVWTGLLREDSHLVQQASIVFLFFALAFWPIWLPLSLAVGERRPGMRLFLGFLTVVSLVWLWLVVPLATEPERWLTTRVVHHSVRYEIDELPAFQALPRAAWRLGYLGFVCLPLFLALPGGAGDRRGALVAGILVAALFAVSYFAFWYAFASVWCFFAAILSLALCSLFYRLPPASGPASGTLA